MKNGKKLAAVVAGGTVGAGLAYLAYTKFADKDVGGDTADEDRGMLETEGDALCTDPENAFIPGGMAVDADKTEV